MAQGATRLREIADKSGIPSTGISKYMRVLERDLDLIGRRYPLLEEGRKGRARYYIRNNFFRFWFSQVLPNKGLIELGLYEKIHE